MYTALLAKQPQQQQPPQDKTAETIRVLTEKINRLLESSGSGSGSRGVQVEVEALAAAEVDRRTIQATERMAPGILDGGTMITTVGHVDLILNTAV
jgi:hypothetical protein